jgi:hypothetical protein
MGGIRNFTHPIHLFLDQILPLCRDTFLVTLCLLFLLFLVAFFHVLLNQNSILVKIRVGHIDHIPCSPQIPMLGSGPH